MTGSALDADSAALSAAGSAAEEALALHRSALALLDAGWSGESGSAATDVVRGQCASAADLVEALHGAAAELRALRDALAGDYSADGLTGDLADNPGYAQASARLSDRAAPVFDTPAPPAAAAAPPAPASPFDASAGAFPAWPSGMSSLPIPSLGSARFPNFGGTLGALVGQVADALSPDGLGTDAVTVRAQHPMPAVSPTPAGLAAAYVGSPAPTPAGIPLSEPEVVVPQQQNTAPLPLLAAELPPPAVEAPAAEVQAEAPAAEPPAAEPPPDPAEAQAADTRTPCEIAADELPQIGQ